MAQEKIPNASCVATVREINCSWEPPPAAHPDWKTRLKRVCYVDEVRNPMLKPSAVQLGITPEKVGTTFVCWGREEIELGTGGQYAFSLDISKGRDINFVNIIGATLIGGEPSIPPLPGKDEPKPTAPAGSPAPTGNGTKDVYIARQCAIERVNDLLIAGKASLITSSWGVPCDPWELADAFVAYFQIGKHPVKTPDKLGTQEHD